MSEAAATTQEYRPAFEVVRQHDFDSNTGTQSFDTPMTLDAPSEWEFKKRVSTATKEVFDLHNHVSWFATCVKQVQSLRQDTYRYEDYRADPPNDVAIESAIDLLKILADYALKPERIASSSDEGVCLSFRNGARYAHLECFNDGDKLGVTDLGYGSPEIWDIEEIGVPESVVRIRAFIE